MKSKKNKRKRKRQEKERKVQIGSSWLEEHMLQTD